MIVITGASGHTGSVAAEKLLANGAKVRVIGRNPARLERLAAKGAEVYGGDVTDREAMTRAFEGASAVYALIPPKLDAENARKYQADASDSLATALERAGVKHAVALSSMGAQLAEGAGPVSGLHEFEERMRRVPGLNVLALRPGYFFENFLMNMGMLHSTGMFAGLISGSVAFAMIATRDIGARAAQELSSLNFGGFQTQELLGPRDYSMDEVAKIIGAAIGKPNLTYTKAPAFMAKPALKMAGLSSDMVDQFVEMSEAISQRRMVALETRTEKNTTPTTLEQFAAEVLAPAFHNKGAAA